ncbi:MAG: hypothetical protein R3E08_02475 [Thiotrichaceae bacterium]
MAWYKCHLTAGTQLSGGMKCAAQLRVLSMSIVQRLINVKISNDLHVVIDAQSTLDDDVVLGAGILFESNVTIPR